MASKTCLDSNQINEWFLKKRLKYNKFNKNKTLKENLKALRILFKEQKQKKQTVNKQALHLNLTTKQLDKLFKANKQCKIYYVDKDLYLCKYKGQIKNGKANGKGTYTCINSKYDGEWEDDKKHGKGVFTYFNGDKYDGQWNNENRQGKGIYYFNKEPCKGDKYEGERLNNKKHGKGVYTQANGKKFVGIWKNDNLTR